jgi:DNA polymerase
MPLDEAALDTLGLSTLWVRRGASTVTVSSGADDASAASFAPEAPPAGAEARLASARAPAPALRDEGPSASELGRAREKDPAIGDAADKFHREREREYVREPAIPVIVAAPSPAGADSVAALDWEALEARVAACQNCRLCEKRTQTVFGVGDRAADWMLIGEGPGENEDKQGEPFVGQAGKLLDSMLRALSLARGENVYIANVVKCRPPGNRNPEPDEVASCEPYLQRQVALVKPKLIVALGRVAAKNLLKTEASIASLRGRVHRYEDVPVVVTYHPAYLLRSLQDKGKAWVDLCLAFDTYRQALAEQQAAR